MFICKNTEWKVVSKLNKPNHHVCSSRLLPFIMSYPNKVVQDSFTRHGSVSRSVSESERLIIFPPCFFPLHLKELILELLFHRFAERKAGSLTRDVGIQSAPPDLSSGSLSPASTSPIIERALKRCGTETGDSTDSNTKSKANEQVRSSPWRKFKYTYIMCFV